MGNSVDSQLQSNAGKPTFVLWRLWTNPYPPAQTVQLGFKIELN